MFFFFFDQKDGEPAPEGLEFDVPTEQQIKEKTNRLQSLGVSCRFQKLPTGNYLLACGGKLRTDLNGLTPESLDKVLGAMIAQQETGESNVKQDADANAKVLKEAVEKKKLLSEGLYKQWQKRMKEEDRVAPECDMRLVIHAATVTCKAVGLDLGPALSISLQAKFQELSSRLPSRKHHLKESERTPDFFRKLAAAGILTCIAGIGSGISDGTAKRIFPMIQDFFPSWWNANIAKKLAEWESGRPAPSLMAETEPEELAFERWVSYSCRRIRNVLFTPLSLALIMESLGPAYEFVESALSPFCGSISKLSPLEWRVASCLMQIEELKR